MARKRLAIVAGLVVLVLVSVVLALPYVVDVNRYRGQLQSAIGERLGRQVSLGQMQLSLLPIGLRIENAVIAEAPALKTGLPFARVAELYVSPKLFPLLTGRFELRSVELRRPEIELVRSADGAWNFSSLGTPGPGQPPKAERGSSGLVLDSLVLSRGRVAITDLAAGGAARTRAVYDNIDLQLSDYGPDKAFDADLGVTLPGEGAQRLSVRGTAGPLKPDAVAMTPFDGSVQLDAVSISGARRFLSADTLAGTDGVMSGKADLRNRDGALSAKGNLKLDKARVHDVDIGYPIALDFDVADDLNAERLTINNGRLLLGQTPLTLTGAVDLHPETPVLDVHATASDASLEEAARLASAFGVAFGAGTRVQGRLNADVRAVGSATRPALTGSVRLRNVNISGAGVPQAVRTDAVDLTLAPAEIHSNDFTAATGGTSIGVRAAVSQYTTPNPVLDAHVHTANADLGEVLNVARAWGAGAAKDVDGKGRLSIDVRASGPLDALSYSGNGSLRDASITSTALTRPLQIRNAALSFSRDAAVLDGLAASLGKTTAQGRLTVRSFAAPRVDFDLSADRLDVRELQSLMAPAPKPTTAAPHPASDDSVFLRTTGAGKLRVGTIAYDQLVLDDVQTTASLDRGLIRLDPLTAGLFGGRHRGAIVVDARKTPATFSVASDLEKVDANRLASAMTSLRDVIFGALGARARLAFGGDGADAIARSLNGTLSINLADGRVANMNLTQEIANIAKFATGQAQTERSTRIAGLSGTFDVKNGLARTQDLTGAIEGGTLGATGTVNLVDQSLDMRLTAVLSREFTERVGATRAGGFMATALANQQGELVVPLLVTGSMQQPRFAPDAQRFAEMKLKNLVPSLRNPGDLTSGILGAIKGGQKDGQPSGNAVGDILGAIAGRRGQAQSPATAEPPKSGAPANPPASPPPPAAQPQKDPGRQLQDALQELLRGRKQEKKPDEQKPPEQK